MFVVKSSIKRYVGHTIKQISDRLCMFVVKSGVKRYVGSMDCLWCLVTIEHDDVFINRLLTIACNNDNKKVISFFSHL